MKRLPKYLHKKIDNAIKKAKSMQNDYWNDWEIEVQHWGSPSEHLHYYGTDKNEALKEIPSTYSHTNNDGGDLVVLQIKVHHLDKHDDIRDTEYIYELEMTK